MRIQAVIKNSVQTALIADREVAHYGRQREWQQMLTLTWVGIIGAVVMSLMNVVQQSTMMLWVTSATALVLLLGYILAKNSQCTTLLRLVFTLLFMLTFTFYTLIGGNDGFAALWLILTPYVMLGMIDLKIGFFACIYYQVMLLLCMNGPLSFLRSYPYSHMFLTRFPVLYAINFAFALIFAVRIRTYQYEILKRQEELERLSVMDVFTGLENRNGFNLFLPVFDQSRSQPKSAIFMDVNGLHEVNNRLGHDAGDKMLRCIALLCRDAFSTEHVFRVGGDEFVILSDRLSEQEMRSRMESVLADSQKSGYTLSYGLTTGPADTPAEDLVREADHKMLENKRDYYKNNAHDRRKER